MKDQGGSKKETSLKPWDRPALKVWQPLLAFSLYACVIYRIVSTTDARADGSISAVEWWCPIVATVLYLGMVFSHKSLMKNRSPMQAEHWMFVYNIFQTIFNIYCTISFVYEVYSNASMTLWGNSVDPTERGWPIAALVWLHYNNKYLELLDTVFMVVRKKDKQVSFLHVFHHVLLIWSWFLVCKVALGGDSWFGACANSFIHVNMYSYYLLALCGVPCPWKKYLTQAQLLQFVVCLVHALYVIYQGNMPLVLPLQQLFVMVCMLWLFSDLYIKSYSKKKGQQKAEKAPSPPPLDALRKYTVVRGKVYDITDFIALHPGGAHLLALAVGRDSTTLFESYHLRDALARRRLAELPELSDITPADLDRSTYYDCVPEPLPPVASTHVNGTKKLLLDSFPLPGDSAMYARLKERVLNEVVIPAGKTSGRGGCARDTAIVLLSFVAAAANLIARPGVVSAVIAGLCAAWVGLAVQHTANHGALAQSPLCGYLLGLSDDLIGGSSLVWRYHHQVTHHLYTNDAALDADLQVPGVRLLDHQPLRWYHRFQFLYCWPMFCMLGFSAHYQDTRFMFAGPEYLGVRLLGASDVEIYLFFVGKLLHFAIFLFAPVFLHGWSAALYYVVFMMAGGFTLATLFMVSHNVNSTRVARPDNPAGFSKECGSDWAKWQIANSSSWGGTLGSFLTGGLNLQIEHHLFPGLAHNCYPAVQKIVQEECVKHKVHYEGYANVFSMVGGMTKFLYDMGRRKPSTKAQ